MIKKIIGIFAILALITTGLAIAGQTYNVDVDTYSVTGSTAEWTSYPLINTNLKVDKVIVTYEQGTDTVVNFYDDTDSTTTVTKLFEVAGSTGDVVEIDFPYHNPVTFNDGLLINKNGLSSETVNVSVQYR